MVAQNGIVKHLAGHLFKMEKEKRSGSMAVYHLNIKASEMFLQVLLIRKEMGFILQKRRYT